MQRVVEELRLRNYTELINMLGLGHFFGGGGSGGGLILCIRAGERLGF